MKRFLLILLVMSYTLYSHNKSLTPCLKQSFKSPSGRYHAEHILNDFTPSKNILVVIDTHSHRMIVNMRGCIFSGFNTDETQVFITPIGSNTPNVLTLPQ